MPAVTLTVLRDGYFDGQYARTGDTITVDEPLVDTLEVAGFAVRPPRELPKRKDKDPAHHAR
jgi:hypothetical protein